MLPSRSKRYVGLDGEIPRLGLATNWQLFLVAMLVLALLVLIFPRKTLLETIYAQPAHDELTLSYLQNLYRSNPNNPDIAILLARSLGSSMTLAQLDAALSSIAVTGDERQRNEAGLLLANAYIEAIRGADTPKTKKQLQSRFAGLVRGAANLPVGSELAGIYAYAAFSLDMPEVGLGFARQLGHDSGTVGILEGYARQALAEGEYSTASACFLVARGMVTRTDEARRLFMLGIDALMSDSQFGHAMQAARDHVGALQDDRETLRYLVRISRSAGYAQDAAAYVSSLMSLGNKRPSGVLK